MNDEPHSHFMDLAMAEARLGGAEGNPAVGSVIVKDGQVIGRGHNLVQSSGDPTAHAETVAIRDACRNLETADLAGGTCYTTMEPCPMCCWAIVVAGLERVVLGARHVDAGNSTVGDYTVEALIAMTGRDLELITGVHSAECLALRGPGG
jgi:tRNA(Arg) A34 adenosine deaminase TadA